MKTSVFFFWSLLCAAVILYIIGCFTKEPPKEKKVEEPVASERVEFVDTPWPSQQRSSRQQTPIQLASFEPMSTDMVPVQPDRVSPFTSPYASQEPIRYNAQAEYSERPHQLLAEPRKVDAGASWMADEEAPQYMRQSFEKQGGATNVYVNVQPTATQTSTTTPNTYVGATPITGSIPAAGPDSRPVQQYVEPRNTYVPTYGQPSPGYVQAAPVYSQPAPVYGSATPTYTQAAYTCPVRYTHPQPVTYCQPTYCTPPQPVCYAPAYTYSSCYGQQPVERWYIGQHLLRGSARVLGAVDDECQAFWDGFRQ